MRFPRATLEWLIGVAVLLIGMAYAIDYFPGLIEGFDSDKLYRVGRLALFGFSLDYLFREPKFFKSKYYKVLLFGLGVLMLAILFKILHLQFADIILIGSFGLIGLSYIAWLTTQENIDLLKICKGLYVVLLIGTVLTRILHLNYQYEFNLYALIILLIAIVLQFIEYRKKSSDTVL